MSAKVARTQPVQPGSRAGGRLPAAAAARHGRSPSTRRASGWLARPREARARARSRRRPIAGGEAFRFFVWIVPLGLVVAATLSLWVELDPAGLENASREFGVGAAAAESAVKALDRTERSAGILLLTGLVFLAWFTVGAVRALLLAYAPARELQPPRIRRPLHAIAVFNGLFLLHAFGVAGVAWLHEHVGATAVVSTVVTLARETAIVLCAMWLLPRRATRMRELLPGAALSPSVGSCSRSR